MRINGTPGLACDALLQSLGSRIRLEPLSKFRVVEDLIVDRSVMMENLKALSLWIDGKAVWQKKTEARAFEASRCLQCGLCLEVCPNFSAEGLFAGAAGAVPFSRKLIQDPEWNRAASQAYRTRVFEGCGKSLACSRVCPAEIDIEQLMSRSNGAALWRSLRRSGSGRRK